MANGRNARNGRKRVDESRDPGGFVALPWSVIDSPSYQGLSHPAKSLLIEVARQFVRDNNGRLLASGAYLKPRGWSSNDVISRAIKELIKSGLIHQTVLGHRPNKASWYAVTWRALDRHCAYDAGAVETFHRGDYQKQGQRKIASITPRHGVGMQQIAPSDGVTGSPSIPSGGAVRPLKKGHPTPSDGDHLDKPSAVVH